MYELLNGMCIILIKIYVLNGDDKNLATRYKLIDRGYVVARIILSNGNKKTLIGLFHISCCQFFNK